MVFKAKNALFMGLLAMIGSLVSSCTGGSWHTFQEGSYKGEKYILQTRSRSGYFSATNSIDWRFRLGKLPYVAINAHTTDWGPVYSSDIFGTNAYEYITGKDTAYSNTPDTGYQKKRTFLYLNPKEISEEEYEKYAVFMREEWPKIDQIIDADRRNFPYIIGIASAEQDQLKLEFNGMLGGQKMILRIENDGRVKLIDDDGANNSESYSGLSLKVQMLGKWLSLDTDKRNGGLTMEELLSFHNHQNVTIDKFFTIKPDSTPG